MLMSSLGTSIANVGLPTLAQAFAASFQEVQWVVLAYLLAITTLIVGLALLIWGSGPVRGFAVVHCLGILTSVFSAVMVSRGLVNLIYGGRKKVSKLSIGNVDWHKPEATPAA